MRGHWTCQFEAGTSALFFMTNYNRFQTWMLGHWTCHFEAGPWPSFVLDSKLWFSGLWWWPRWGIGLFILMPTCHLKLGLRPSFILNNKLWLFLDLDDGALVLSLMTNYDCFWTWMMGRWTWSFEADPSASSVMTNYDCFRTWMMERWTCHLEAGPSAQLLS